MSALCAAESSTIGPPSVLIKEQISGSFNSYLIAENTLLCEVLVVEVPLLLLAAYYTFNVVYPHGLTSLFTFLGIYLCDLRPAKKIPAIVDKMLIAL